MLEYSVAQVDGHAAAAVGQLEQEALALRAAPDLDQPPRPAA